MAVYYKFKSAKDFDSVPIDGHFISVGHLKEKIFESKHLGRGTDFDLVVTNAQNNEEYLDEGMLIPKNTSVLIRRVPGRPRKPIITAPVTEHEQVNAADNMGGIEDVKSSFIGTETSTKYAEELEWDEFGNDLYAIPETAPTQSTVPVPDPPPFNKEDEDSKIKALIETPSLDWLQQPFDAFGRGRGFGRGMGGRMMGGRGFGRGGFENKTPPPGYVCYRCKVPGHFIQHCPTNGDPNYDVRRVKPPTGIPKSMLMATADGSYALPTGDAAVLKPNEAVFEKEIEGMPTTRSATDFPPELHCPLCKEVMKDAVLTSKCCFTSFCDKCIRDHIISKSMCVCGATNVLADDLLPNKTLRDTISRILESNNSSADKSGSAFIVQDMESRNPQANVPSLMNSAVSKEEPVRASRPEKEETLKVAETIEQNRSINAPVEQGQGVTPQVPDVPEAIHGLRTVKEAPSQGSALLAGEEVQQKQLEEAGKKKKKKKLLIPSGASEMPWGPAPELAHDYMMPMGPSVFNPYYGGVQPGLDGFMPPFPGPGPMPYMGYGPSPMDMAFGGAFPNNPFGGPQCMLPYGPPPQRDLAELAMGFKARPPFMSREEFEARKANLRQKREMERDGERELPKDREYGREGSSTVHVSSTRPKSKAIPPPPSTSDHQSSRHHKGDRRSPDHHPRDLELPRPSSKRKSDHGKSYKEDPDDDCPHKKAHKRHYSDYHMDDDQHHHRDREFDHHQREDHPKRHRDSDFGHDHTEPSDADLKQKASSSVFSRISYQERDSSAPRTLPSRDPSGHNRSNGLSEEHKTVSRSSKFVADVTASSVDRESSDDADERHYKRRRPKHTSSPSRTVEEWPRHFKGSRDRERNHGGYSKRR